MDAKDLATCNLNFNKQRGGKSGYHKRMPHWTQCLAMCVHAHVHRHTCSLCKPTQQSNNSFHV